MQLFLGRCNVDVHSKDKGLWSLLLYATKNRHLEIVQLFMVWVNIGVDVKDKYGWSPLWYATKNKHLEIVQQTSKGANQLFKSSYNTCHVWVMSYCECDRCWLER
jgi:ankyrin repeat protein